MSVTIANFKQQIANYMNRTLASLNSVNSQDMLLAAMNNARRAAQRDYAFELNRVDVFINSSLVGSNWMTGCKTAPSGGSTQLMRRIDSMWNYNSGVVGTTPVYPRTSKVDLGNIGDYKRELPTFDSPIDTYQQNPRYTRPFAYFKGQFIYVNSIADTNYLLDGIAWLDDLADGDSPDIFLTYFTDWFLWATIIQLNMYLKDSERFPVDNATVARLWESVKEFDGQHANSGDGANLD